MRANQLPLWFASLAYVPLYALQRIALKTAMLALGSGTVANYAQDGAG